MSLRILLKDQAGARWLQFSDPVDVFSASNQHEVATLLRSIESRVNNESLWAAGFITYEAAAGFDAACETLAPGRLPLLSFGLFQSVEEISHIEAPANRPVATSNWQIDTPEETYLLNVDRIREQIASGNTYQVNYTIRGHAYSIDDPWCLFLDIARDAPFAAYIEDDDYAIVSASPELFFRLDGKKISSRPMKGTATRGLSTVDDLEQRRTLAESVKDRAENVMIADMLRNDLGRIADPGSVVAESLFDIEKYPTVWQATSTVAATTDKSITDIVTALFPCASITGAPKIASMRLIASLETSPRGIYTGAIGYFTPERVAQFSVAIRTAVIDKHSGKADYGVGSGIVWDSQPALEYAECLAKGRILRRHRRPDDLCLLETILWTRSAGFFLLEGHLARLRASAEYFDFKCDLKRIRQELTALQKTLSADDHRIRLLLHADGALTLTESALTESSSAQTVRVRLAASPVNADSVFLYHKTTHRMVYEQARAEVHDCDDVLLWNEDGYLTESTIANVAVRFNKHFYTPPVRNGLLPGVYREHLLSSGKVKEWPVRISELADAEEIILFNSLRKVYAATLL